jgi:hypothetical protein
MTHWGKGLCCHGRAKGALRAPVSTSRRSPHAASFRLPSRSEESRLGGRDGRHKGHEGGHDGLGKPSTLSWQGKGRAPRARLYLETLAACGEPSPATPVRRGAASEAGMAATRAAHDGLGKPSTLSWQGLSLPSRLERLIPLRSGMAGTSPAMTGWEAPSVTRR